MAAWNVVDKNNPFFISIKGWPDGEMQRHGEKNA
jgi:hypothetical protein